MVCYSEFWSNFQLGVETYLELHWFFFNMLYDLYSIGLGNLLIRKKFEIQFTVHYKFTFFFNEHRYWTNGKFANLSFSLPSCKRQAFWV